MRLAARASSNLPRKTIPSNPPGTDTTPLPLHTDHLSPTQHSHLAQNPTYAAQLTALQALAAEVRLLQASLQQREVGKIPSPAASKRKSDSSRSERDTFAGPREECRMLEEKLKRWDDELAGLAEALLARPRFVVDEHLVWGEGVGGWWWRVPEGPMMLPRHRQSVELLARPAERYAFSNFPSPKLTRRITKLFRRSPSPRSRLQRQQSTSSRFVD